MRLNNWSIAAWDPGGGLASNGSSASSPVALAVVLSIPSSSDVRFTPESRQAQRNSACPLCAKSGHRRTFLVLLGV